MPVTDPYTDAFCQTQVDDLVAAIAAYRAAILALSTGSVQQYSLDTGQTRTVVTKQQVGSMRVTLNSLENDLAVWVARCNGASARILPGF